MDGKAYHCSFHEEPTVGYQHPGPTLYFDIMAGSEMKSKALGALSQELVRIIIAVAHSYHVTLATSKPVNFNMQWD